MTEASYVVRAAEGEALPLVVSIPHTGTRVPEAISANFASEAMHGLPNTDWHLHRLYEFLPRLGVSSIHAVYSRLVVDLNRPPKPRPLYPGRVETGLVPSRTFQGEQVWITPPDEAEIARRRDRYHRPYHEQLGRLLEETRQRFGRAVLIDAHSIASAPSRINDELEEDVYLGDRDGETCGEWLIGELETGFREAGLRVVRNYPFKGGYITDHYGRMDNVEAVQIEMTQRVYMNETDPEGGPEHPRFEQAQLLLEAVIGRVLRRLRKGTATD
jgi:N-formylglutamate deformylase